MKTIFRLVPLFLAVGALLVLSVPQNDNCDLESILLQDDMMPHPWEKLWRIQPPALPKEGAVDALNVVYEKGGETAQHTIYRYRNSLTSFLFLRINKEVFFPSGARIWSEIDGSHDELLNGDEVKILCGDSNDPLLGNRCSAVVRYGSFLSDFSSPIGDGIMSQEEFNAILFAIDKQIVNCVQSSTHQ